MLLFLGTSVEADGQEREIVSRTARPDFPGMAGTHSHPHTLTPSHTHTITPSHPHSLTSSLCVCAIRCSRCRSGSRLSVEATTPAPGLVSPCLPTITPAQTPPPSSHPPHPPPPPPRARCLLWWKRRSALSLPPWSCGNGTRTATEPVCTRLPWAGPSTRTH